MTDHTSDHASDHASDRASDQAAANSDTHSDADAAPSAPAEAAPSAQAGSDAAPSVGTRSPKSFAEFWPFYLGEHRSPLSRGLHYFGTSMAVGAVLAAAFTGKRAWLLAAPVLGYGPAWIGHFKVEKNRPASFKHPLWSLAADFKMLRMALRFELRDELRRLYGSAAPAPDAPLLSDV